MCATPRESKKRRLSLLTASASPAVADDDSVPSTSDQELIHNLSSHPHHLHESTATAPSTPIFRKRQMERDRRDLINLRFRELHQLLRSLSSVIGSSQDHNAENMVDSLRPESRRINKEGVLKDALLTLDLLRRQGVDAALRNDELVKQLDGMRAEMSDLRRDKQYLRSEVQQCRVHNNMLWQHCQQHVWKDLRQDPNNNNLHKSTGQHVGIPAPNTAAALSQRFKHEQCLEHTPFETQRNPTNRTAQSATLSAAATQPTASDAVLGVSSQRPSEEEGPAVPVNPNPTYNNDGAYHIAAAAAANINNTSNKNTPDLLSIQDIAQLLGQGA